MKKFKYNLSSVNDCIRETEKKLRDLISTELTSKYGPNWETSSSGLPIEIIDELKEKIRLEQSKYSNQQISTRLIDYSDISDLKNLIIKNWDHFNSILFTKERTSFYFDELK